MDPASEITSGGFILGSRFLAHAERNPNLVPEQLERHADGGDTTQNDLQQHAAGTWIQIGKNRCCGHQQKNHE